MYADGVATDQDGNQFEWINYGNQDWAIENAKVVTYRDGTPIPQVTDANEWSNLTTGAWCYYNNDSTETILYNWYAVMGIQDNDPNTPNKEFSPEGWSVPIDANWTTLEEYLINNGYNYDGTTSENKIAKSLASTSGIDNSTNPGAPGNNQSENNKSGFNNYLTGYRATSGGFTFKNRVSVIWSSTEDNNSDYVWIRNLNLNNSSINRYYDGKRRGFSVRFVRDAQTASVGDNSIYNFKIFPNPTKEYLNIYSPTLESVVVYNILGKELIKDNVNRINVSLFPKGVYFIKVSDGMNSSTKKFIKN